MSVKYEKVSKYRRNCEYASVNVEPPRISVSLWENVYCECVRPMFSLYTNPDRVWINVVDGESNVLCVTLEEILLDLWLNWLDSLPMGANGAVVFCALRTKFLRATVFVWRDNCANEWKWGKWLLLCTHSLHCWQAKSISSCWVSSPGRPK